MKEESIHEDCEPKCANNCLGVAEIFLNLKANTEARNENGYTALCLGAENGHTAMVRLLASRGAQVNIMNNNFNTPFYLAARNGHRKTVLALSEYQAAPTDQELFEAAECGSAELLEILSEGGVNFESVRGLGGCTLLHRATNFGNTETLSFLLKNTRLDVNAKDSQGSTPLHYASTGTNEPVVRILLENGANVNSPDNDKATPLYLAEAWNRTNIAALLKHKGGLTFRTFLPD